MNAEQFKRARIVLGLTQSQMAEVLGYGNKQRVSEIERGAREPGTSVVLLINAYISGYRPAIWPVKLP